MNGRSLRRIASVQEGTCILYWLANTREGQLTALLVIGVSSIGLIVQWGSRTYAEWRFRRACGRAGGDPFAVVARHAKQASMGVVAAPFFPLVPVGVVIGRPLLVWTGAVGVFGAFVLDFFVEPRELLPPRWLRLGKGESWRDAASTFVGEVLEPDQ